jgi:hypothetical protein
MCIRSDIQSNFPELVGGKILKFQSYFSWLLKILLCWTYQCAIMKLLKTFSSSFSLIR